MIKEKLGNRMKRYEAVSKSSLVSRMPVIIRLDGKAFHTFTRGFDRPFDDVFMEAMQRTTLDLCEKIQGCVLGYVQSDEISLLLIDYKNVNSCAWFDNEVQKICSISSSIATLSFNRHFCELAGEDEKYKTACLTGGMFDSRCFNVPDNDVANYFIWRQKDATRNSIQMVGQRYFSHRELEGISCEAIQEMLFQLKGINWNNFEISKKRGTCCIKVPGIKQIDLKQHGVPENKWPEEADSNGILKKEIMMWSIDREIPIFTQDRDYIENLIPRNN